jgi:hypothetical protein
MSDANEFLSTAVKAARLAGKVILANLGKISRGDIRLKKAADYRTDIPSDSFDKFFTVFVAYNALYNEAARRLVSSGRICAKDDKDKESATVHAPAHIGRSVVLAIACLGRVERIVAEVDERGWRGIAAVRHELSEDHVLRITGGVGGVVVGRGWVQCSIILG